MNSNQLYTIAQISEETGIHPQTLRNWEKDGILEPNKVNGNQRIYNKQHLALIKRILKLKDDGLRIKGIRTLLIEDGTIKGKQGERRKIIAQRTVNKNDQSSKEDLAPAKEEAKTKETAKAKETPKKEAANKKVEEEVVNATDTGEKKQGRPQMHTDNINFDSLPKRKERGSNYRLQDLEDKNLTELLEIGKEEGVPYFRQMFKEELQVAIAFPSMREELREEVKKRLKDRYGGRVYGVKNREKVLAQKTATAIKESDSSDLAKAEVQEEKTNSEQIEMFKPTEGSLVSAILQLAESGKTAEEIEEMLVSSLSK